MDKSMRNIDRKQKHDWKAEAKTWVLGGVVPQVPHSFDSVSWTFMKVNEE